MTRGTLHLKLLQPCTFFLQSVVLFLKYVNGIKQGGITPVPQSLGADFGKGTIIY